MRKSAVRLMIVAAVAIAAAVTVLAAAAKPREIHIVAKDMAFYVNGDPTPNPTLRVKAGEQIRLVLRNEDPGMTHDFAVAAWEVATKTLTAKGAQDSVKFRVPKQRGTIPYQCTPHSQMMKGTITIE